MCRRGGGRSSDGALTCRGVPSSADCGCARADLGYVGCLALLVYKYKRDGGRNLTRPEVYFNNLHEFIRNRVENALGLLQLLESGTVDGMPDGSVLWYSVNLGRADACSAGARAEP